MSYILFACQLMVGASAVLAVICSIGVWRSDNIRGMSIRMKPKSIRFSSNINIPSNSVGSYTTLIKTEPVMTIENGKIPLLGCDETTFFRHVEQALTEIVAPHTPEVVKTAVDNAIQGLAPQMFLGMSAKLAREAGMSGIPPEVPDAAYLSHDGITCNVTTGEDSKLTIVMTFEIPRWASIDIRINDKVAWLDSKVIQRSGTVVKSFPAKTPFVDLPSGAANDDQEDLFHRVNRLCDYSFHDRFVVETAEGTFAAPRADRLKVVMRVVTRVL